MSGLIAGHRGIGRGVTGLATAGTASAGTTSSGRAATPTRSR